MLRRIAWFDRAPIVVDGDLRFAACPDGCDGIGSTFHTAHRLCELGKQPKAEHERVIAFQLEETLTEIARLDARMKTSTTRAQYKISEERERQYDRAALFRSWLRRFDRHDTDVLPSGE